METHDMVSDTLYYSLTTTDLDRNLVIQSNYMAICITICYIMFTKVIGPNIMKNREPMIPQFTMLLYKFFLAACNAYLAVQFTMLAVEMWSYRCNFKDSPIHTERNKFYPTGMLGLLLKFLELLDTVIFVLRKKFQHVSFFHVYHHAVVFFFSWIALKIKLIGYYVLLLGSINFSVHIALHLYYALAALGPDVRKYLWWKKYLATLQIVEFFVVLLYMVFSAITGCDKYSNFDKVCFACIVSVAALFINFYTRTYKATKKSS